MTLILPKYFGRMINKRLDCSTSTRYSYILSYHVLWTLCIDASIALNLAGIETLEVNEWVSIQRDMRDLKCATSALATWPIDDVYVVTWVLFRSVVCFLLQFDLDFDWTSLIPWDDPLRKIELTSSFELQLCTWIWEKLLENSCIFHLFQPWITINYYYIIKYYLWRYKSW